MWYITAFIGFFGLILTENANMRMGVQNYSVLRIPGCKKTYLAEPYFVTTCFKYKFIAVYRHT